MGRKRNTLGEVMGRARSRLWIGSWVALSCLAASCGACVHEPRTTPPSAAPAASDAGAHLARMRSVASEPPHPALPSGAPGTRSLELGGSVLRVQLGSDRFELGEAALLDWITSSARAIAAYYGAFPVREAQLVVHAARGGGVHGGHTEGGTVPRIDIRVGLRATPDDLRRNWSLAHEMVHLALPDLARSHHWLEEGLASYVEPIARARAGLLEEGDVWREWLDNLALGLPEAGDRGLDHTPTWGRTYWGGALFCFQADLEIRKQTGGRFELRDALRAIVAEGGNLTVDWPIERVLRAGDAATGVNVLVPLYAQLKDQPVSFDLRRAWRELGVSEQGGEVRFDDAAPLSGIRQQFVRGR